MLQQSNPVAISIQPLPQPRPVGEQRLVRDFDDRLAAREIAGLATLSNTSNTYSGNTVVSAVTQTIWKVEVPMTMRVGMRKR